MDPSLEKRKLDSQFSIIHSLDQPKLEALAADYEALLKQVIGPEAIDIADRLQVIYSLLRSKCFG